MADTDSPLKQLFSLVLHLEFQGRTSHQPMPWRMLEYMARLAYTHRLDLWSVVILWTTEQVRGIAAAIRAESVSDFQATLAQNQRPNVS